MESFCNIINVFTVNFDQLNVSLLNKNIFFQKMFVCKHLNGGLSNNSVINWNVPVRHRTELCQNVKINVYGLSK